MNPSLAKLISHDAVQDQSSSMGLSKTIKRHTKGRKIFDLIGGLGSFANILEKSGTFLPTEKKGDGKEGSVNNKGRLTGANNEVEKASPGGTGIKAGKNYVGKKEEKITGNESVTREKDLPLDGTMKRFAEVSPSKIVSDEKKETKILLGTLENAQSVRGEKAVDKDKGLDLTKALHGQHSKSADNESTLEAGKTVSLIKDIPAASGMKKSISRESMPIEGEAHHDVKPTTAGGTKENIPIKKNIPEGMRLTRAGDGSEDDRPIGDVDLSKGFEIKGVIAHKVSSDTKEDEIVLKSNSLNPEVAKENTIPTHKVNQLNEMMQEYKNLLVTGQPSEKPVEKSLNDTPVTKIDTSLSTAQADFSGVKGIGNYASLSNMNADIATPVQFQDIMDQIEDSAAKMLKKGPERIVITLEPPNLGTLNLDVKVHNDMVRLVLIADSHEVKQVLQTNLDQLKTALQDHGLNMDHFDVLVQQRSSENPGFHQWGGALFEDGRGRRENTKEDSLPPQLSPVDGDELNEPHLGSISLFA
jgi:flagellar hook-length control protein FliK